jgi:flagellar hook-length control protein FliK
VARPEVSQQVPLDTDRATLPTLATKSAERVRLMVEQGERSVSVRLAPESLGRMQIEVRTSGNDVSIRIVTASAAVREAFDGQVGVLREALARDGIQVSRVDVVSTGSTGSELGSRTASGNETMTERRSPETTTTEFVEGSTSSAENDRSSPSVQEHAGLNVLV